MRRRTIRICAIAAAAVFAANAGAVVAVALSIPHEASLWPSRSYSFWPERSWKAVEARINALPASPRLIREIIGTARYRQGALPVHSIRFAAARLPAAKVLLVSGIHGSETAGVEALLEIAEQVSRRPDSFADVDLTLVPVANPWAWVYGYRYDGIGEDVNRDFASGRTQEAAILRTFIDRSGPYELFMDLHESKKSGYFLYQYVPPQEGMGNEYGKLLEWLGKRRENAYREGPFQAHDGVLTIPAAVLPWIAAAHRLSLEQYARLRGTRHAYTVETPVWDDMASRVDVQKKAAVMFIHALAGQGR
jgi:hypothetical protein